ncbi:MAG: hypothetical protein Fur0032_11220 [Terrimicrobiaceae bacterium]
MIGQALAVGADPEPPTWDLGRWIDVGLQNSPATRSAWARAQASREAIGEARSAYYPDLIAEFRGGADRWYTPAATAPDNFNRLQATVALGIEYLLLDFGRRDADVKRTLAMFEAAGWSARREMQAVVFAIQSAYFQHEAAARQLEATRSQLRFARLLDEQIRKEVATGLRAEPELREAAAGLAAAEAAVAGADARLQNAAGRVRVAAGLPANAPVRVAAAGPLPTSSPFRADVNLLVSQALALRPDIASAEANVVASEAASRRAAADFYPEVRLEAEYVYSNFRYTARDGRVGGTFQENLNGYGAFLTVSWDIFDGFERISKLRRRRADAEAARLDLEGSRLQSTGDVWTAYHDSLSTASDLASSEISLASAEEDYRAREAAAQTGLIDITELSLAASRLAEARAVVASAVANYSTATAALALAIGSPPADTGTAR